MGIVLGGGDRGAGAAELEAQERLGLHFLRSQELNLRV